MSQKPPFATIGDEPIEARIVAWVLGDASAFEATELERLCDERPELLVFRRRMRALHGLLSEAETAEPDHSIKLSPEKRRVLDEIFGVEEPPNVVDHSRAARSRSHLWRKGLLAIAACLVLVAGLAALFSSGSISVLSAHKNAAMAKNERKAASAGNSEVMLEELKKAIRIQEDAVEERRKVLANIVRSKGIAYYGLDSYQRAGDMDGDGGAKNSMDTFNQLEGEKAQLEGLIQGLLKYDGDQLMTYASGLALPDNTVQSLYPKYLAEKTKLEQLKIDGLADQHPTLQAHEKLAESLKKQLDEGVVSLRDTLQAKLELADARFKRAQISKNEKRGDAIKRGLDAQEYVDAKREFESEQEMLQQMKLKLIGEEIASKMPDDDKSRIMVFRGMDGSESLARRAPAAGPKASDNQVPLKTASTTTKRVEATAASDNLVPLKTDLPPELIEGTPSPIVLNRATPAPASKPASESATKPGETDVAQRSAAKSSGESASLGGPPDLAANTKRPAAAAASPMEPATGEFLSAEEETSAADGQAAPGSGKRHKMMAVTGGKRVIVDGDRSTFKLPPQLEQGERFGEMAPLTSLGGMGGVGAGLGFGGGGGGGAGGLLGGPGAAAHGFGSGSGTRFRYATDYSSKADFDLPGADSDRGSGAMADAFSGGDKADKHEVAPTGFTGFVEYGSPIQSPQDGNGLPAAATPPPAAPPTPAPANSPAIVTWGLQKDIAGGPSDATKDAGGKHRSESRLMLSDSKDALQVVPESAKPASAGEKNDAIPTLGDLPIVGKLFAAKDTDRDGRLANRDKANDASRSRSPEEVDMGQQGQALAEELAEAPGKTAEAKSTSEIIREFDGKAKAAATTPAATESVAAPPAATMSAAMLPAIHDAEVAGKELAFPEKHAQAGDAIVTNGILKPVAPRQDKISADGQKSADLSDLVQLKKSRLQTAQVDSDRYLVEARDAYAKNNYQQAYDNYAKGLELLPDAPATKDRREFLRKSLGDVAVALANDAIKDGKNDEAKEWLGKAVEWNPDNEAARQKVVADVASEATAADVPYSTFSLSISDISFKMTQASMARGERPEPSLIKVEQFYNAVDYGDPAPGPNEAVAGRVEQAAHPVIPGRNLVRVAVRTGAAGRSAAQPLRLTLLVDQSGSMARDDRRAAMALALKQLAGLLTKNDLVTVIGFSRSPRLLADGLAGDQGAKLSELVNQAASEGGTNLEEAMKLGEQMALRHQTAGAQNRIVLFTDGAANLGDADPSRLADKVTAMRQKGLAFDIAGIGTTNLNDQLLAELARHGNGRYCVVGAETDAGSSFARQLAGAFRPAAENVKVQVRFNPQRVGRYKLLGFEEHRLKTEDFRNDAVDAAELAAEEAGVALYQVEPLAEGSGELGEASLRFRDAASGRMVERTWTIPYDAAAPAFDRATPSLQLAGLSLLAAEKLRGGPLAEAIDFKQFVVPRATVKQFYSNSRRVAEMLEMVDKL